MKLRSLLQRLAATGPSLDQEVHVRILLRNEKLDVIYVTDVPIDRVSESGFICLDQAQLDRAARQEVRA